jgi:uncharacterized protein YfdQ (DUF2303 family)
MRIAPDNFRAIDTEQFQLHRRRFRGRLATNSLSDFILYVKSRVSEGEKAPGFIDGDKLSATMLFNLGTPERPGHGDDTAHLALKASPAYSALIGAHGSTLQHLDALNWLQDWADHITYADDEGNDLPTLPTYNALRKLTISATSEATSEERTHGTSRSALEQVEARGASTLPAFIRFTCTPYAGLPERGLWLRVNVREAGGKAALQFRIRNLDGEKEAIAQDFKTALLAELESHAALVIGTFTP